MEFVIYKTKLSDFIKELKSSPMVRPTVYFTTMIRQREKGKNAFVIVLSAFNSQNQVLQLNHIFTSANEKDIHANESAKHRTKAAVETLKQKIISNQMTVQDGYLGGLSKPLYGTLELQENESE